MDFLSLCGTGSLCLRFALAESCSEGGIESMMCKAAIDLWHWHPLWSALRFPDANALSLSFRQNSGHLLSLRVRALYGLPKMRLIEALYGRRPDVGRP